jgi:hypothetical protein
MVDIELKIIAIENSIQVLLNQCSFLEATNGYSLVANM